MVVSFFVFSLLSVSGQNRNKQLALKDTIKDPSIQIPQELEYNLEQMLVDWKKNYKQSPDCNLFAEGDIAYHDSVYINRLYGYPSEMELAYNQIVRSYIDLYTSRRRTSVQYMLAKGKYYFPVIEEVLDKYGLPLELKYLPIIESALNPVAVSRMGATGLWQFMLRTGKMYDLEVNSLVDERRDPLKATEAAARYLKDLYDIYEDWNLVIAAYNCGPGNVNKAIRRSGGLKDYWAIYPNLPRETRGYVPAFIAATYVMNFHSEHNICPAEFMYPVSVDTLMVNRMLHFQQISDVLNIPIEEIRELNPQYKKDIIPGEHKGYALCLPSKSISEFITNQDTIFSHKGQSLLAHRKTVDVEDGYVANGKITKTHKIRKGESLGSIAQRYGTTVAQLKRLNNLRSNNISAGKTLVISRAAAPVKKEAAPAKTEPKELATNTEEKNLRLSEPKMEQIKAEEVSTVSVESSNSFFADYYKNKNAEADAEDIKSTEELVNDTISIVDNTVKDGSELASREHFEDKRTIYHKVKIGETIPQIAKKYDVTAVEIVAWNKMSSKKIKIGQRLLIKLPEKTEIEPDLADIEEADSSVQEKEVIAEVSVQPKKKEQPSPSKGKVVYRVRKGDSLSLIAKRYGKITAEDIMMANNLKNDKLSIGQELKIPVN